MSKVGSNTIELTELVKLHPVPKPEAVFYVGQAQRQGRCYVKALSDPCLTLTGLLADSYGRWAVPTTLCGDAPTQYHPKYVMAILSAVAIRDEVIADPWRWPIPAIPFGTEEFTRRSMALNGMRMSLEYFETGSPRILQLVEQRLAAGQRDVVHDVLVYLMQRVLDIRADEQEARLLRAEAVAAYLGLNQSQVNRLFLGMRLNFAHIARRLEKGYAGPVRRAIDVPELIKGQLALLRPALRQYQQSENQALHLLDKVALLLSQSR